MAIRKVFWVGATVLALALTVAVQAADHGQQSHAGMSGMGMMHEGMGMMGNSDAKLTREQFMQHAEARFARMDHNGDGVIDSSDRQKMQARMRDCMQMMGGMDGDNEEMKNHH